MTSTYWSKREQAMVQIVAPSNDHVNEILLAALHSISLATPPVWISQIVSEVLESDARKYPSGE